MTPNRPFYRLKRLRTPGFSRPPYPIWNLEGGGKKASYLSLVAAIVAPLQGRTSGAARGCHRSPTFVRYRLKEHIWSTKCVQFPPKQRIPWVSQPHFLDICSPLLPYHGLALPLQSRSYAPRARILQNFVIIFEKSWYWLTWNCLILTRMWNILILLL